MVKIKTYILKRNIFKFSIIENKIFFQLLKIIFLPEKIF